MDIYEYIPSPDIAEHCKKIGHVFTPVEMAVIAEISGRPLAEKHAVWRQIINEYPDMPIYGNAFFEARESLHEFMRELIEIETKEAEAFLTPEDNAVYRVDNHRIRANPFNK